MHQNLKYASATSFQIGNPDRDVRVRLTPYRWLDRDIPVQTFVIVSERETRLCHQYIAQS